LGEDLYWWTLFRGQACDTAIAYAQHPLLLEEQM